MVRSLMNRIHVRAFEIPEKFLQAFFAMATSNPVAKLSRGDWKKAKELEEARKAGTAPAEVDEEGK